jgi:hypothetical protein
MEQSQKSLRERREDVVTAHVEAKKTMMLMDHLLNFTHPTMT